MAFMAMGVVAQLVMPIAAAPATTGANCVSPLGPGTAGPNDPFWRETITHQVCYPVFHKAH